MDFVEKGINDVQEHMKESIQKHNDIFAKTIYDAAKKSNQCSTSFDRSFHKTFPESNNMGTDINDIFNPTAVFEFKEGIATDVIETWDKTLGIVPNRKVMGTYHIDLSNSLPIEDNPNLWMSLIPNHISEDAYIFSANQKHICRSFNGEPNYSLNDYKIYVNGKHCAPLNHPYFDDVYRCPRLKNKIVTRGEERKFENYIGHYDFEVDNYLNIYHKDTGLYLMLHKTTFPDICFYFAKQYTQLKGKDYYKIYESKRMERLGFELNGNYLSKDKRCNLISTINTLLPENYKHVYELYNNFRKLQPIKQLSNDSIEEISESDPYIDVTDPKDRIIEGLRNKLNETIKRCGNNETIVTDMIEQYNNKSVELQSSEREKKIIESKLSEMKLNLETKAKEMECEIEKVKHQCDISITEVKESKDRDTFEIYKRLSEAEVFRAKSEALGISYDALKSNLEKETLEKKKFKDMNKALLTQFEQQKERNNKLSEDNNSLLKQLDENIYLANECKRIMDELNSKVTKKEKECFVLGEKLSQMGETSDSALENALSDRVNDLEAEISELKTEKSQLDSTNKKLVRDLEKIRGFMSHF